MDPTRGEDIPVEEWQKQLLDEREHLVSEGKAHFSDWEIAKERVRRQVRQIKGAQEDAKMPPCELH